MGGPCSLRNDWNFEAPQVDTLPLEGEQLAWRAVGDEEGGRQVLERVDAGRHRERQPQRTVAPSDKQGRKDQERPPDYQSPGGGGERMGDSPSSLFARLRSGG